MGTGLETLSRNEQQITNPAQHRLISWPAAQAGFAIPPGRSCKNHTQIQSE